MNHGNISRVVAQGLCTGCGVCSNVCPVGAIRTRRTKGLYLPAVDETICRADKGCSRCLEVCPGTGIALVARADALFPFPSIRRDPVLGRYLSCYAAHSADQSLRYHASSGGALSQFLVFLLREGRVDGAIVTGFSPDDPLTPVVSLARTEEEILAAKGSKYCPVSMDGVSALLREVPGKVVLVGLPCHVQGLRNLAMMDRAFKEKVAGCFAIYCSSTRTFHAQEYLLGKYKIDKSRLRSFAYRDEGCMGNLKATYENGEAIRVPYLQYWHAMRGFFVPSRCVLCIDHFGELADVAFGDLYVGEYKRDSVGVGSVVTRSPLFDNALKEAAAKGYLAVEPVEPALVKASQEYAVRIKKGGGVQAALGLRKRLGLAVPVYDGTFVRPTRPNDVLRAGVNAAFRWVGHHPPLWFIISIADRVGRWIRRPADRSAASTR